MAVRTSEGLSDCFSSILGLKQGCPLSPTLFGLFLDELEQVLLDAVASGAELDLPRLAGVLVALLLYADDLALVATSAAGLQAQLDLLHDYCARWKLTVNISKTKVVLLSGARGAAASVAAAEEAGLTYGGQRLASASSFCYLGVQFSAGQPIAGSAAPARVQRARRALVNTNTRCAALGVAAAAVRLQLFTTMVDSVLSFGSEVWAVQLVAAAAGGGSGSGGRCSSGSLAEALHLGHLRRLLGVRQATPNAAVLAETGEQPLWVRWLRRAARLWNRLLAEPAGSLLRRALDTSLQLAMEAPSTPLARRSWAAQLAAAMAAVGMPLDLLNPRPVNLERLKSAALARHVQLVSEAAAAPGATKLAFYVGLVRGGALPRGTEYAPAAYLGAVRSRSRRVALAQLRTGSHWGAEETGRWARLPREQRVCPHCSGGVEDVPHMLFDCPLYAPVRARFPDLFTGAAPSVRAFLEQDAGLLAGFAAACSAAHSAAADARAAAAEGDA